MVSGRDPVGASGGGIVGRLGARVPVGPDAAWLLFFAAVAAGWGGLLLLAADHPSAPAFGALAPGFDGAFWQAICAVTPLGEPFPRLVLMWGLMAGAMMAPTAVPMLGAYRGMTAGRAGGDLSFAAFLAGYLAVWLGFAVAAAGAQAGLAWLALLSPHGVSLSPGLTALLLVLAGLYQFSALKAACLAKCRSPFAQLMSRWRAGPAGALAMGARHGAVCVGCCWALMLLAFVGGTMNLIWMGAAMALMIVEKLPRLGQPLTRPLGVVLILAGGVAATRALGLY